MLHASIHVVFYSQIIRATMNVNDAQGTSDDVAFFSDQKAMTTSEVAIALEQYTRDRKLRDPSYQPNILVSKTIEYTNTIATNKNPDTVRKIRRYELFLTTSVVYILTNIYHA